jgi:glycosyltransferase involved in cell wall biosynthesis
MPKILYLVTEDWYFCSHRLPIARAARDAGFEVVVVTRVREHGHRIEAERFRLVPLEQRRGALSPISDLLMLVRLIRIYLRERPDLVHHVALKPVLYGTFAARLAGVHRVVNAMGGLGYLFGVQSRRARWLGMLVRGTLRALHRSRRTHVIVQNPEDEALFRGTLGVSPQSVRLIRGSGVDIERFSPVPAPKGPVTVALVSRMLWAKGVAEFVEAARCLRDRKVEVRMVLVGAPDLENPGTVPEAKLHAWGAEGVIEWWGRRDDVETVWAASHLCVLPSYYREGVPKALLEAAACGRPIITTDTPGCREIVRDGENGILVPPRDAAALADAIERLVRDPLLRARMGARGRRRVEEEFSEERVVEQTLALYRSLLADRWPA